MVRVNHPHNPVVLDALPPLLRFHRTRNSPSECSSHDQDRNVGITGVMADNFRPLATCSGTNGKNLARRLSLIVRDVEPSSLEQRQGMVTFKRGSARSKIDAKALQIASE